MNLPVSEARSAESERSGEDVRPMMASLLSSPVQSAHQLAESTYRSLRDSGLSDTDIMAFAGELLSLVAAGVRATPDVEP